MGGSINGGTPESSILIKCSLTYHPFWGYPHDYGKLHIFIYPSVKIAPTYSPMAMFIPKQGIPAGPGDGMLSELAIPIWLRTAFMVELETEMLERS